MTTKSKKRGVSAAIGTLGSGAIVDAITAEETLEILSTLIRAVREKYGQDPTSPSVILSEVGPSGEIYASVVRYGAKYAQEKQVVVSVKTKTLGEAVRELSKRWLDVGRASERLSQLVGFDDEFVDVPDGS